MFRRRRRRSRGRMSYPKKIQHYTNVIGESLTPNASLTHFFANAGAYQVTGTSLVTARTGVSNREQENTVGSKLGLCTIEISFTPEGPGIIEYAVFKRERQSSIPSLGSGLPSNADILSSGLQTAQAVEMPARTVNYGQLAVASEQPRVRKLIINWDKFKMSSIRTGDWYGITIFNRSLTNTEVDVQVRYKEII